MKLNRITILAETHYGLQIYAYVLKQFYRDETLQLRGHKSNLVRNPFNGNKKTLQLEIRDRLAVHHDVELENFSGDVFDFANLYFKMGTMEELYYLLNQVMHLNLKVAAEENLAWLNLQDDSWRPRISFFRPPIRNILPLESISLHEIYQRITGNPYRWITEQLRCFPKGKESRAFKAEHFPYVTFSGVFSKRNDHALTEASQLMVLDFDGLPDLQETRQLLMTDEHFEPELLFVSPSGDGLKWVIRHGDPRVSHRDFFLAVSNYLKQRYRLQADPSGKDLSRACFLPHDAGAYLHPRHEVPGADAITSRQFE